jgi:hypothetical protein
MQTASHCLHVAASSAGSSRTGVRHQGLFALVTAHPDCSADAAPLCMQAEVRAEVRAIALHASAAEVRAIPLHASAAMLCWLRAPQCRPCEHVHCQIVSRKPVVAPLPHIALSWLPVRWHEPHVDG